MTESDGAMSADISIPVQRDRTADLNLRLAWRIDDLLPELQPQWERCVKAIKSLRCDPGAASLFFGGSTLPQLLSDAIGALLLLSWSHQMLLIRRARNEFPERGMDPRTIRRGLDFLTQLDEFAAGDEIVGGGTYSARVASIAADLRDLHSSMRDKLQ